MSDDVELKIRLKITLSTEVFQGAYHSGAAQQSYMLNHPVTVFSHGEQLLWRQSRDLAGNLDDRLPGNGLVAINQGTCVLSDKGGQPIVTLGNFTAPVSSQSGPAVFNRWKKEYQVQKASQTTWVGKGVWELVNDESAPPPTRYLTSAWKYNTSASSGVGGLVVEFGQGILVFTDPTGIDRRLRIWAAAPPWTLAKFSN